MTILREWEEAFPDSRISVKNVKTLGNTVVVDLQWAGTHDGPLYTTGGVIQPTGKKIDIPAHMTIDIGESESAMYEFGDLEPVVLEGVSPKAEAITYSFDIKKMEEQIELTPEERVA